MLALLVGMMLVSSAPTLGQAQPIPPGSDLPQASTSLEQARGGTAALQSLTGERGLAVIFWSNQCPWVDKYEGRIMDLASTFEPKGVSFVLVNANDPSAFPKESASASRARAKQAGYDMPYLMDKNAALAEAFGAERTPHIFLFDAENTLVYVGTVDDSPGDPGDVTKTYLRSALNAVVQGQSVSNSQTKAFGCTLKLPQ